jgi:hypothetical protein
MDTENQNFKASNKTDFETPMLAEALPSPSTSRGRARELADSANELHQQGMDKLYALSVLFGHHVADSIETPFRDSNDGYSASAKCQMDATTALYDRIRSHEESMRRMEDENALLKANLMSVVAAGLPLSKRVHKQKSKVATSDAEHFDRVVTQANYILWPTPHTDRFFVRTFRRMRGYRLGYDFEVSADGTSFRSPDREYEPGYVR